MPRLFTGLEIPPHLKEQLAKQHMPLPGAKWIDPADYHITLRFIGDVDNRTAAEFADLLAGIDSHAFEVRIAELGTFGGNDPRVLYAAVEPSAPLEALARAHDRAARQAGLAPEKRAFKPHVTLARLRNPDLGRMVRFLERFGGFRSEAFTAQRFVLYSSKPGVGGGPYVIEETYPLHGWSEDFDEGTEAWS
jgi:2'-5' RNA ligase